jgi:hypothetical protein
MTILKPFQKFIQCDYNIYNIVMLSPLSIQSFLFNHMPITIFKILQKQLCGNLLGIV